MSSNEKDNTEIPAENLSEVEKSSTEKDQYITPPDGGRGWLVVTASFMVNKQTQPKKKGFFLNLILTFKINRVCLQCM